MPNWCDNNVTISGSAEQLNRVRKGVQEGNLFEEFVPIPANYPKDQSLSALWGTKWEMPADEYRVDDFGTSITLGFMSAWSPPIEVYNAMVGAGLDVEAKWVEPGMAFYGYFESGGPSDHTYSDKEELPDDIVETFGLEYLWDEDEE